MLKGFSIAFAQAVLGEICPLNSDYGTFFRQHIDLEWIFIDSSIVKAHQHSTGARGQNSQAIGKSVAGNTTKIHLAVDSCGNPIDFILTGGEVHDSKAAS